MEGAVRGVTAAELRRAATTAVRECGSVLARQLATWPAMRGPCVGVVIGPGRTIFGSNSIVAGLLEQPDGHRCGVVEFACAESLVAVEVIALEAELDGGGARLMRALCAPTEPGEVMCVVLLEAGAAVVPVTPLTRAGG